MTVRERLQCRSMQFKFLFMGKNIAAFLFILFLVAGLAATIARFPERRFDAAIINGEWMKEFDIVFGERSFFTTPSKMLWAEMEKGKREVVIGEGGQFYTAEEFLTSRRDEKNYQEHVDFIEDVQRDLAKDNIHLLIAVIPSKAREEGAVNLAESKRTILTRFAIDMASRDIDAVLLSGIKFLKTDTHWSPEGAKSAALQIAKHIKPGKENFRNSKSGAKNLKGDLQKFVSADLPKEKIDLYELNGGSNDLFGEVNIPVVLVGTSYSAKREFNFENFLKEYLKSDVLNMADEGRGPFAVMKDYLAQKSFNPDAVIWEIPERYLTMHLE